MFWSLERVINDLVPEANRQLKNWEEKAAYDPNLFWYAPIFDVTQTNRITQEFQSIPSVEEWLEMQESEDFTLMEPGAKQRTKIKLSTFGRSFGITRMYNQFGQNTERLSNIWDDVAEFTIQFMQSGMRRHSVMAAGCLLNAFDASLQPMRDGSALCDTSHTDFPVGNKFTKALGMDLFHEVDTATHGLVRTGATIEPVLYNFTHIVVGPKKKIQLKELLNTIQTPYTNFNTINPFYQYVQPVICPYLDESIQEGASEYVFFIDANLTPLKGKVAYYPTWLRPWQRNPNLIEMPAETIFSYFALWAGGIAGSTGEDGGTS